MKFFKSRLQIIGAYAGETSVVKIAILHLNLSRLQARFTHYVSEFIQATFRFQADLIQPLVSCTQNDSILFLASISFKCSYHFYTIYIHDLHRSWKKNQRVKFKVSECPYFQLFGTLEPAKTSSPATSELLWANSRVKLRWLDPVFLRGYHPTLKLSGIPTFTFIVSLTHRMDNIQINLQYNINFLAIGENVTWL